MKITIAVPSIVCSRCGAEAPVQPQLLYPKAAVDPAFAAPMSEILRVGSRVDCPAVDDTGLAWQVVLTSLPRGWAPVPTRENGALCPECTAAWTEAAELFMVPPLPEVEETESVEAAVGEAVVAEEQVQPQTNMTTAPAPQPSSLNSVIRSYTSQIK